MQIIIQLCITVFTSVKKICKKLFMCILIDNMFSKNLTRAIDNISKF